MCIIYNITICFFQGSLTNLSAAKEPYILVDDEQDCADDDPNSPYSVMIGEQLYCKVPKSESALGHCLIELIGLYYIYHLEYPQRFRNVYFFVQQFVVGDTELPSTPRIINRYHESIRPYLAFANSLWVSRHFMYLVGKSLWQWVHACSRICLLVKG